MFVQFFSVFTSTCVSSRGTASLCTDEAVSSLRVDESTFIKEEVSTTSALEGSLLSVGVATSTRLTSGCVRRMMCNRLAIRVFSGRDDGSGSPPGV